MPNDSSHVTREQCLLLAKDRLPADEKQRILRHLLSKCEPCLAIARETLFPENPDYSAVMRRLQLSFVVAEGEVQAERNLAAELWSYLRPLSPEHRLLIVKNDESYQIWGLFDLLVHQAKLALRHNPIESVDLIHLALAVTELLDRGAYGDERVCDFQGAAYAALGNVKRILGDFAGAKEALSAAQDLLRRGTGDFIEEANLISIRASLLTDLGYLEDATNMLRDAVVCARAIADEHLEGRIRIQQASSIVWVDPVAGRELVELGLILLERNKDPYLELGAHYIQIVAVNELGYFAEARNTLETFRPLFRRYPDPSSQGRLLLLDGLIARNESRFKEAERLLRTLVALYEEHSFEFDLALATLDLAEVLALQGKTEESVTLLAELYPVLQQWGLHGDILRAWMMIQESVLRDTVHRETFKELELMLRRKWYRRE
jgi:tetratricopeptide (TPR) repeat protein